MDGSAERDGVEIPLPRRIVETRPVIPWSELTFRADTSSGPGGQHANRSATRVTLLWQPATSTAFEADHKEKIEEHCSDRMNSEGVLRIRISSERSQAQNKRECIDLLKRLIREALEPEKPRVHTKPTRSSRERRLQNKQHRSKTKSSRKPPGADE